MPLFAERFLNLQHFRQFQIGMLRHRLGREPGLQQALSNLLGLGVYPLLESLTQALGTSLSTTLGTSLGTTLGKPLGVSF